MVSRLPGLIALVGLALVGCSGTVTMGDDDDDDDVVGGPDADPNAPDADPTAPDGSPNAPDAPPVPTTICDRWNADRGDMSEGTWSGSVASCAAGDVAAPGRANAVRLINLYRFMAGLPAVTDDPTRNAAAQECALMMHANGALNHDPPPSWNCYTSNGALGAGRSNIATTPGVRAIDLYMVDPGNSTTLGHRRWFLSNSLGPIGVGSTSSYSCHYVIGGSGGGGNPWTAFPSPGAFPIEAMTTFSDVDSTGWSVQSDSINLNGATVTITSGGDTLPVSVTNLLGGYGSAYAIRIVPQGWSSQAGSTYRVSVTGIGTPIEYDVSMVDCE